MDEHKRPKLELSSHTRLLPFLKCCKRSIAALRDALTTATLREFFMQEDVE